jgi:hypothetical protein
LERPRELTPRVLNYINGTYGVDEDAIGAFLVNELPKLEDDEIDLVLSPLFTPKLADQAVFAGMLGAESIPREQLPPLVEQLATRPTIARFVTPDGREYATPLREVIIERYVHRLRLEGGIPEPLAGLLTQASRPEDAAMLQAVARRAVWENAAVRGILVRYFERAGQGGVAIDDAVDLLNLVEGRKPASLDDLLARMPAWQQALRDQVEVAGGARPFFHDDIRMMHGDGRDQRTQADPRMSVKEKELDFLIRLQQILIQ